MYLAVTCNFFWCPCFLHDLTILYIIVSFLWIQTSFNVIAYKDKPRLGSAVELLRTTQVIERQLGEVWKLFLLHFCCIYYFLLAMFARINDDRMTHSSWVFRPVNFVINQRSFSYFNQSIRLSFIDNVLFLWSVTRTFIRKGNIWRNNHPTTNGRGQRRYMRAIPKLRKRRKAAKHKKTQCYKGKAKKGWDMLTLLSQWINGIISPPPKVLELQYSPHEEEDNTLILLK